MHGPSWHIGWPSDHRSCASESPIHMETLGAEMVEEHWVKEEPMAHRAGQVAALAG